MKYIIYAGLYIKDNVEIEYYIDVNIKHPPDGRIKLFQLQIILSNFKLWKYTTNRNTPKLSTNILHYDDATLLFSHQFYYRNLNGIINFLEESTQTENCYVNHQCARFSEEPKTSHGDAVKHLNNYLSDNMAHEIISTQIKKKVSRYMWIPTTVKTGTVIQPERTPERKNHILFIWVFTIYAQ